MWRRLIGAPIKFQNSINRASIQVCIPLQETTNRPNTAVSVFPQYSCYTVTTSEASADAIHVFVACDSSNTWISHIPNFQNCVPTHAPHLFITFIMSWMDTSLNWIVFHYVENPSFLVLPKFSYQQKWWRDKVHQMTLWCRWDPENHAHNIACCSIATLSATPQ